MTSKKFLQQMKENLLSQKKELLIRANQVPDIDTDGDEIDEIQGNLLIELANQLSTRDMQKISRIDSALHRIDNDTYGLCDDCGDSIPEKRLLSNPHFMTCVMCAEEREAQEKQRKRF